MIWTDRNCGRCVKATISITATKYRCAIQRDIEEAAVMDGMGKKRVYDATHSRICPYIQTERKKTYKRKVKKDKNQLELEF